MGRAGAGGGAWSRSVECRSFGGNGARWRTGCIKDDTDISGEVTGWGLGGGVRATSDAPIVARLRRAGAIIIGKTNVPELDLWPWTSSPTFGVTRNPWDRAHTPGGSSGGSAAAVAVGMCGLATGSDGGGSIRYPAAQCGVFGLKPQRDRIPLGSSRRDAWNGLLALGALTRSVADTAVLLDAAADGGGSFVAALAAPMEKLTIAVSFEPPPRSLARLDADHRRAVEATAAVLCDLGHRVVEQSVDYGGSVMQNISMRYAAGVAQDLAELAEGRHVDTSTRRVAAWGRRISASRLRRERDKETAIARRMNRVFERADVVLTPATGGPPPMLANVGGRGALRSLLASNVTAWMGPWNCVGQPAASIPSGLDASGLPLAVQLCGPPNSEERLLRLSAQIEETRPWAHLRLHR